MWAYDDDPGVMMWAVEVPAFMIHAPPILLLSGKPVVAQDTGFGAFLPTGAGLLSFATEDDALAAVEDVRADYERHVHAARNIAEQHLDSRKVLTRFLERVGATS